jgi:hypothetical protein
MQGKPTLTNHERLENNQEKTEANIKNYLEQLKPTGAREPTVLLEDAINSGKIKYPEAIKLLEERRDAKQGIAWITMPNNDGKEDLIRDARNVKDIPPLNSIDSYAIQLLNIANAAEKLIEIELKQGNKLQAPEVAQLNIRLQALSILQGMRDNNFTFDIKDENAKIVNILKNAGISEPDKKLSRIKDFMNFYSPQYHISTITTQLSGDAYKTPKLLIESNTMLLGVTNKQKEEYEAIKNGQGDSIAWFANLKPEQKAMIQEHADGLAEGKFVLPTQLRGALAGIRNAYSKTSYIAESNGKNMEVAVRTFHAGTPSFHGKDKAANQAVTEENLEQLKSFLPQGKTMTVNILNSPANPSGIDSSIADQITNTAKKTPSSLKVAVTPANFWRRFSRNDNAGFEQALKQVASIIGYEENKLNLPKVKEYLETGKGETAARIEFSRDIEDPYYNKFLYLKRKAAENKFTDKDLENLFKFKNEHNLQTFDFLKSPIKEKPEIENLRNKFNKIPFTSVEQNDFLQLSRKFMHVTPELIHVLNHAMNARHYMDARRFPFDPENSNLQLAARMKIIASSAEYGALKDFAEKRLGNSLNMDTIVTNCASGKDRTGVAETMATALATQSKLGYKILTPQEVKEGLKGQPLENISSQVKGGHTQTLAACNGGSLGADGVKKDTAPAIPKSLIKAFEGLVQKTASFNKFKFTKPTKIQQLEDTVKKWMGQNPEVIVEHPVHAQSPEKREPLHSQGQKLPKKNITSKTEASLQLKTDHAQDVVSSRGQQGTATGPRPGGR